VSLPKIRLERCERISGELWKLDGGQERHLTRALRFYDGAMVEGLLPGEGGGKLIMRLESGGGARFLREISAVDCYLPAASVALLIGLLKADQFDSVLRSSSELGVREIRPLFCERSVPRFGVDELPRKTARWQKILDESSKVSGFVCPTKILPPSQFDDFNWTELPDARYAAMLSASARPISEAAPGPGGVAFAVGPEGDWTEREVSCLIENKFLPVSLGPGVLRSSTAAVVGCGWFSMSCTA
jgi:16S rRNA (uracil1498-N3)-methyltransferase